MNNLTSVNIKNYKCFHRVSFNVHEINILIGENNAGKSTAIEAIKLIAYGIEKLKTGNFIECPDFVSDRRTDRCVKLNVSELLLDITNASYNYEGELSIITGYFSDKSKVIVIIDGQNVYGIAYNATGQCLSSRYLAVKSTLPSIYVMPRFNLLRDSEKFINEKRTKRDRFNYRSSLHFRNELFNYKDDIPLLNEYLKKTWQGMQIEILFTLGVDDIITAMVRDNAFSAEIKQYGSGLQMWMQILWFLCKISETNCIVVLDEPDVYIHADLQRKLYHLVADTYTQVIIATHSIEIINETAISNIMIVDKKRSRFIFCNEKAVLDRALKSIGTTQNLMLTKLQRHNKCLFVEGNDLDILDEFYKIAINNPYKSIKEFATSKLGGKDNYKEAFGVAKLLYEDSGGTFKTFCLLDRDYNDEYNQKIKDEADRHKVVLYVLNKLEIENYLIVPRVIAEILNVDIDIVNNKIQSLAECLKGETFDRILQEKFFEYRKLNPSIGLAQISLETRVFLDKNWDRLDNILSIVPGKELKSKIFEWIRTEYKISINDKLLLSHFQKSDIPNELVSFLNSLNGKVEK